MEKVLHSLIRLFAYSFISLFVYSLVGLLTPPVYAEEAGSAWYAPSISTFADTLFKAQKDDSMMKEGYDSATGGNMIIYWICIIMGCSNDPQHVFNTSRSTVASTGTYIAAMYQNPPADLALWANDAGQTLGFIPKQANAQGIGFSGLSALLPIWKAFRNIAYLLLAIIMIIVGFMVMFRKQIDPKTVVTVQNAIPKIVVTLLLITFSYAIVGILIDLMYLVMLVGMSILVSASGGVLGPDTASKFLSNGFGGLVRALFAGGMTSIFDLIRLLNPAAVLGSNNFNIFEFAKGFLFAAPESILLTLLISVAILFTVIRVFFLLLNAYVHIIMSVIFAPLELLMDAIPGESGFGPWMANLISNLAVFPITAIMVLIGTILVNSTTMNIWIAPLLSSGGGQTHGVAGLIGLGVLMIIPTMANSLKEKLKAKPGIPAGPGSVFAPVTGAFQTITGTASQFYYSSSMMGQVGKWISGKKDEHTA